MTRAENRLFEQALAHSQLPTSPNPNPPKTISPTLIFPSTTVPVLKQPPPPPLQPEQGSSNPKNRNSLNNNMNSSSIYGSVNPSGPGAPPYATDEIRDSSLAALQEKMNFEMGTAKTIAETILGESSWASRKEGGRLDKEDFILDSEEEGECLFPKKVAGAAEDSSSLKGLESTLGEKSLESEMAEKELDIYDRPLLPPIPKGPRASSINPKSAKSTGPKVLQESSGGMVASAGFVGAANLGKGVMDMAGVLSSSISSEDRIPKLIPEPARGASTSQSGGKDGDEVGNALPTGSNRSARNRSRSRSKSIVPLDLPLPPFRPAQNDRESSSEAQRDERLEREAEEELRRRAEEDAEKQEDDDSDFGKASGPKKKGKAKVKAKPKPKKEVKKKVAKEKVKYARKKPVVVEEEEPILPIEEEEIIPVPVPIVQPLPVEKEILPSSALSEREATEEPVEKIIPKKAKGKRAAVIDSEEEEDEIPVVVVPKKKQKVGKKAKPVVEVIPAPVPIEAEEEEEEEIVAPVKVPSVKKVLTKKRVSKTIIESSDLDEEATIESDESDHSPQRKKKAVKKVVGGGRGRESVAQEKMRLVMEAGEAELEESLLPDKRNPVVEDKEEEEEEEEVVIGKNKENVGTPVVKAGVLKPKTATAKLASKGNSNKNSTPKLSGIARILAKQGGPSARIPGLSSRSKVPSLHTNLKERPPEKKALPVAKVKVKKGYESYSDEEPKFWMKDRDEWDSDECVEWSKMGEAEKSAIMWK